MNDESTGTVTEPMDLTDKEAKLKASKKAAAQKMMERKRAALDLLIALAERQGDAEEKAAAEYLKPGRHIAGSPKAPKTNKVDMVSAIFDDMDSVHEDDIYLQHKLGRTEMRKVIQTGVNNGTWITFDPSTGLYTVVLRDSPEAPEGWLGAMPKQPKVL